MERKIYATSVGYGLDRFAMQQLGRIDITVILCMAGAHAVAFS